MTKKKYGSEISETPEELREDMKRNFINEAKIQPNIHVKATYSKDKITKISVIYSNNVKVFTVHCEPIISQISGIATVTNEYIKLGKKMCIYDMPTANDISYLLKNAGILIANLKSLRSNEDER